MGVPVVGQGEKEGGRRRWPRRPEGAGPRPRSRSPWQRGWARLSGALILWLALAPSATLAQAAPGAGSRRQVLILNAYNPTYQWTANIVSGVRSVFDPIDDVELNIEFMDTKKVFTPAYAALLSQVYAQKYHAIHFDLIISSDDDALDFLKTYRDRLFPGVPVVFCGANSFRDERIAGFSNVTGVNEESDLDESFSWVARLRPSTRQLVFVVDASATSAAAIRQLRLAAPRWQSRFAIKFIADVSVAELEDRLRTLPQDALVFWQMFMRDKNDRPLSMAESHRRIVSASPVPVFGLTDVSVSLGAAGGYVVSGFSQGETAARMGLRILAGTPAAQIPIVRHSPNVYMIDYPAFKRWHLDTQTLPPGAVVINRPFSFYERYRRYVWAMLGGMGAETLVILALIGAIRRLTRKSRARLRQSEERYRSIVEDGSELIGRFDPAGQIVFANGALARFAQQTAESLLGRSFQSLLVPPGASAPAARPLDLDLITPPRPVITREESYAIPGHGEHWVLWTYRGMFSATGDLRQIQAVGHDITDRRAAEEAVRAALLKVEEGNLQLGLANRNLQDVLDSMKEGLLVCDRQGILGPIRSHAVMDWFGTPAPGQLLWDFLFEADTQEKLVFQVAFEQVADDILPFDLNRDQLPRTFRRGESTYAIGCQQVKRGGAFVELVFTLLDVTRELERERIERINREQPAIVANLLRDREGFQAFAEDTRTMLLQLNVEREPGRLRRLVHTLKGNVGVYGFETMAAGCDSLEEAMAHDEAEPTPVTIASLTREWQTSLAAVQVLMPDEGQATVRLSRDEYQELVQWLERRDDPAQLLHMTRQWAHPTMSQVLGIHARTVRQLATRLGKEIEPRILDHGLRMPFDELRAFLGVLVHVVRNASDHGIEAPEVREKVGKPRVGRIAIESRLDGAELVIAVEDDGAGIDWEAVRVHARKHSLPADTPHDLTEALFADGLTTRGTVTDVSGRGVGLGAVREVCRRIGGAVRISSALGQGTRVEFRFPLPFGMPAPPAGHAMQVS